MIEKLIKLCRGWGGDVIKVSPHLFSLYLNDNKFYPRPSPDNEFSIGVFWEDKKIITTTYDIPYSVLIHEMGHVFACDVVPDDADDASFSMWECLVSKEIGLWNLNVFKNNKIGFHGMAGMVESLKNCIQYCEKNGLAKCKKPIAIR